MPDMTSIETFVDNLSKRQTNITRALKRLWDERDAVADAIAIKANLAGVPFDPVHQDIRNALIGRGLTNAEVTHLNGWPPPEKEKVRTALQAALGSQPVPTVAFFWELYDGPTSRTRVTSPWGSTDVHIIFQSPQRNVRKSGATYGDIYVDI